MKCQNLFSGNNKTIILKCCLLKSLSRAIQSFVSLTSSLEVKMLTVLVSMISNLRVFLLYKCE